MYDISQNTLQQFFGYLDIEQSGLPIRVTCFVTSSFLADHFFWDKKRYR